MLQHIDSLEALNNFLPLKDKMISAHRVIHEKFDFIVRIAVTLYDPQTRILKTYIDSSEKSESLESYQFSLDNAKSLKAILKQGRPRVVQNPVTVEKYPQQHKRIGRSGYAASYTMPIFHGGEFLGFLFFNSHKTDVFDQKTLNDLDIFGHMVSLMIINELATLKVMSAALKMTRDITHLRDPETGSHLDRMSRYSRMIAQTIAGKHDLDDEFVEYIFMFSPLHDIGKIAIPDTILLKEGVLSDEERRIMNTHTLVGRKIIDSIVSNFGLDNIPQIDLLRNIVELHHETIDGSGYPHGKKDADIPLEARVVAVADIFDALTSNRPYKQTWRNDKAFGLLRQMAGEKLDADCVNALIEKCEEVEQIQQQFQEDYYG